MFPLIALAALVTTVALVASAKKAPPPAPAPPAPPALPAQLRKNGWHLTSTVIKEVWIQTEPPRSLPV